MLMLRAQPDDTDPAQAREAGNLAAGEIGRQLVIRVAIGLSDDGSMMRARPASPRIG